MAGTPERGAVERWPWWPSAPRALRPLAADRPDLAALVADPGPALLILAHARPDPATFRLAPLWGDPGLAAAAAGRLAKTPPTLFADPDGGAFALAAARRPGKRSPEAAALAARLVGLGELAAARAGRTLSRADAARLGRRLMVRWGVPNAWAATASYFALPAADAAALGADPELCAALRQASGGRQSPVTSTPETRGADAPRSPVAEEPELVCRLLIAAARLKLSKRREAAWREQAERLDAVVRTQGERWADELLAGRIDGLAEFAAGASHEINNPLAIISGNAQLLRGREADPDRRRKLDAIVRAGQRVHDILANARQFARPPAPNGTTVGVAALLGQVAEALLPAADECGADVRTEVLPDDWAVRADAGQARRALEELARNALAAAGRGGWVRLGASAVAGGVALSVEDSGPGPSADDVPHLFDPFYSGRDAGRGRGLGLSVAYVLARQNGGGVRYEPRAGVPGRFVLRLPAAGAGRRAG